MGSGFAWSKVDVDSALMNANVISLCAVNTSTSTVFLSVASCGHLKIHQHSNFVLGVAV